MPDRNTENHDNHDLESYEAKIFEQREFTERLLRINRLVDGMRAKALVLKCNRKEYDSISRVLPKFAVLSEGLTSDLTVPDESMSRLRMARELINVKTIKSTKTHFKDVLEKMEAFRLKIVAENGVEYLTDFDDKPGSVRDDLFNIFGAMEEGKRIDRRIGYRLSESYGDKSHVLLRDYDPESGELPMFNYVLQVLTQLDEDILHSLESGDDVKNISKLILQRLREQCSLMYNETAGQYILTLRTEKDNDYLGDTDIEKMQAIVDIAMRTLFCLSKNKEALRWLEK